MQKQTKQAALICLILTPMAFWFGARIGALITTKNVFDSLGKAIDKVGLDIASSPILFNFNDHSLTLGIVFMLSIWVVWMLLFGIPRPEMVGAEHGTARWATTGEIKKFKNNYNQDKNLVFSCNSGMATERKGFSLKYDRNLNVAVIGGSGSGKTRYYVKPNLMQMHGNYFVTDPKGTVESECGPMMRNNGYSVRTFNVIPDTMNKSMCFNPLYYVRSKEQLLAFVNCLIKNTTPKNSQNNDPFWEKSEILLYVAVLGLMMDWLGDDEFILPNLVHYLGLAQAKEEDEDWESPLDLIFKEIETGYMYVETTSKEAIVYGQLTGQSFDLNFGEQDVLTHGEFGNSFNIKGAEVDNKKLSMREGCIAVPSDIVDKRIGKSPWEEFVNSNGVKLPDERSDDFSILRYKEFKAAAGKTLKSIIISCNTRLMPIAIPEVTKILSGKTRHVKQYDEKLSKNVWKDIPTGECEMKLDELGDPNNKQCIFAVMSDTNDTYFFLVAIMMYQVIDLLCTRALTKYGGRLPEFVHFIFDEFANLGVLKDFERTIAITRSRNIGISLILQTPFQLKQNYEENAAKVIIDNCDTMVYLGGGNDGADVSTCKEVSARLGKQTIHTQNLNINKGNNPNTGFNNTVQQRDLMLPDEVARLPRDEELVIIKNTFPYKDKKFVLNKHKRYSELKGE